MKRPDTVAEERESRYAGWQPLAKVLNTTDPFFDQFMFLQGYEFSPNIYLIVGDSLTIAVDLILSQLCLPSAKSAI